MSPRNIFTSSLGLARVWSQPSLVFQALLWNRWRNGKNRHVVLCSSPSTKPWQDVHKMVSYEVSFPGILVPAWKGGSSELMFRFYPKGSSSRTHGFRHSLLLFSSASNEGSLSCSYAVKGIFWSVVPLSKDFLQGWREGWQRHSRIQSHTQSPSERSGAGQPGHTGAITRQQPDKVWDGEQTPLAYSLRKEVGNVLRLSHGLFEGVPFKLLFIGDTPVPKMQEMCGPNTPPLNKLLS